jgi:hypothetical protein
MINKLPNQKQIPDAFQTIIKKPKKPTIFALYQLQIMLLAQKPLVLQGELFAGAQLTFAMLTRKAGQVVDMCASSTNPVGWLNVTVT